MNFIVLANTSSKPLLDEYLPSIEEISGDKMSVLRSIFERLFDRKTSCSEEPFLSR